MSRAESGVARLDGAIASSEAMIAAARAGDWERLVELERDRATALGDAPMAPGSAAEADALRTRVGRLIALNEAVAALASAERTRLSVRARQARAGRRAARAYDALSP